MAVTAVIMAVTWNPNRHPLFSIILAARPEKSMPPTPEPANTILVANPFLSTNQFEMIRFIGTYVIEENAKLIMKKVTYSCHTAAMQLCKYKATAATIPPNSMKSLVLPAPTLLANARLKSIPATVEAIFDMLNCA